MPLAGRGVGGVSDVGAALVFACVFAAFVGGVAVASCASSPPPPAKLETPHLRVWIFVEETPKTLRRDASPRAHRDASAGADLSRTAADARLPRTEREVRGPDAR